MSMYKILFETLRFFDREWEFLQLSRIVFVVCWVRHRGNRFQLMVTVDSRLPMLTLKSTIRNIVPLSVNRTCGVPHLLMIECMKALRISFPFAERRGTTSIHSVNASCRTRTYWKEDRLGGKGPIMSADTTIQGCSTTR